MITTDNNLNSTCNSNRQLLTEILVSARTKHY